MQSKVEIHPPQASKWTLAFLALVALAGVVLRFYQLGAHDLWLDEIFTGIFVTSKNTWAQVFERIFTEPNPLNPLIYVVTHGVLVLFGESSVTLRLLAATTGSLGVLAIYFVGQAYFNRRVGLIAALLLSIAPMHIVHSREARYYAPVMLFSLLSYYFLHRGLQTGQRKWWFGFALASILNIYSHLTAFFVLITEVVYVGSLSLRGFFSDQKRADAVIHFRKIVTPLVFSLFTIAVAYLPLVPVMIRWANGPQVIGNESNTEGFELTANFFLQLYANFGAGLGLPLSIFLSACLLGLVVSWRADQRPVILFLLMTSLPFLLIVLTRPVHFFAQKYVISIMPLYLIFIARGIEFLASRISSTSSDWINWKHLRFASLAVLTSILVTFSLQRISQPYNTQVDKWQAMSTFLEANVQPGDAVAVLPTFLITAQGDEVIGYLDPLPPGMDIAVPYTTAELSSLWSQHERVWIVEEYQLTNPIETEHLIIWLAGTPSITLNFDKFRRIYYISKDVPFDALLEEVSIFHLTEASLYASLAETYVGQELWDEGVAAYQKAIGMDPDEGIWHMHLGKLYEQMGEWESAEAEHLQAVELQPEVAGLHAALADYYRLTGQRQSAIDQYTLALTLWREQIVGRDTTPYSQTWQQYINELQAGGLP